MTAINKEQIREEFLRQVKLCSGIGRVEQMLIMAEFWNKKEPEKFTEKIMHMCDLK